MGGAFAQSRREVDERDRQGGGYSPREIAPREGGRREEGGDFRGPRFGGDPGEYRTPGPVRRYVPPGPAYPPEPPGPVYARRPNSLGSEWREQQEEARSGVRHGQLAPLTSVIAGINRRARGRTLDAGIEYQGGRPVYRVRWLTSDGRRVDYLVDAATGQILSEH